MIPFILVIASAVRSPIPEKIIQEAGFDLTTNTGPPPSLTRRGYNTQRLRVKCKSGETLDLAVKWSESDKHKDVYHAVYGSTGHLIEMTSGEQIRPRRFSLPSRLPPKMAFENYRDGAEYLTLRADGLTASVQCLFLSSVRTSPTGFAATEPINYQTKSALVERIIRHTLANAAGLRLDDAGVGALAGRSVKKAKCRRSNRVFGRMDEWTNGEGWSFAEDQFYGLINLKKGSKWAVLPLGADQIKVNGVWKEMGDSAAFLNGKLYLPEAGLRHLKDGS